MPSTGYDTERSSFPSIPKWPKKNIVSKNPKLAQGSPQRRSICASSIPPRVIGACQVETGAVGGGAGALAITAKCRHFKFYEAGWCRWLRAAPETDADLVLAAHDETPADADDEAGVWVGVGVIARFVVVDDEADLVRGPIAEGFLGRARAAD